MTKTTARPLLPLPFRVGEDRGKGSPGDAQTLLTISNRQRTRPVSVRHLRQIVRALLDELLQLNQYELGISLVGATEMTRLNETFLQHAGSTDVITFDHAEPRTRNPESGTKLHGELFICVDEAFIQASRFRTTWQSEIARYVIHGVLHLLGHDDHRAGARRKMKREEARRLRQLGARFALSSLGRNPRLRP